MKISEIYNSIITNNGHIKQYIGQCDVLRKRSQNNEDNWQEMMARKSPITREEFLRSVDLTPLLDEDESVEDFINYIETSDPSTGYYQSFWGKKPCVFYQTAGFEFIFI